MATLGTAITDAHADLISKYANEVYIAFDGDKAGNYATKRANELLQEKGISTKVIRIPQSEKDPVGVIKTYGVEGFERLIKCVGDTDEIIRIF